MAETNEIPNTTVGGVEPSPPPPSPRRVDLTQGGLRRGIVALSWPIVLSSLLQCIMQIADLKMVGVLGPESIAAVGISISAIFLFIVIMFAISTGTQVLVAQYTGLGDPARVSAVARQSLIMTVLSTLLVVTPLGYALSEAMLRKIGADATVLRIALPYMQLSFLGMIFMNLNFILGAILQGAGDTVTPLLILVGINVLHILFNWLFIFGIGPFPELGVAGAAWGVIISRALGSAVAMWVLTSGRFAVHIQWRESWAIDLPTWWRTMNIGFPNALQGLTRNLSFIIMNKILMMTAAGTIAVAAFTVSGNVRGISIMIGLALMSAAMTVVGQNCGAGQLERAERGGWWTTRLSTAFASLALAVYVGLAYWLIRMFTDDQATIDVGVPVLRITALGEPAMVAGMALAGALRGAGDTWAPLWASVVATSVVSPVVAYVLAIPFGMGPNGVAIGFISGVIVSTVALAWMFKAGRWKRLRLTAS